MSPILPGAVLAVLLAAGCSKHEPAPPANAAPASAAEAAPLSPRSPGFLTNSVTAVVTDTGKMDATLAQLTAELRRYVVGTRTVPRNFEEFAAKSQLQAPPPPPGKKYAIQRQEVVLVNK